jgi:type I restriction enzyme M protein
LGGKRSFFKGEYEKYSWTSIFDPRLGGVEMLNLYGEAITKMSQNANLPELFRNIFKNAYLPYRDPETLKLFLKTINDFTYDHSEKLGDAFEYLLSVLGSQGDAGQFRTPRHIIDFMVQVVDPQKNETVLDPACGTAGFLISAYKHILKSNAEGGIQNAESGVQTKALTAQQKQQIFQNFTGYDISPDMVRLSLVNLYLHGFVKPQIHEYDSLASEERWNEYADVILANPPFMSPKGGIMPHKKFSVQSNRSEVLFVDYMAEHLTPNGRAAIIVPEGIIFQSAGAYKQLRSYLIEHNFLWAVVSLPAGAFNPYSGVKTSILFLDKSLAKKTDKVLFVKVTNDGFDLGAQRRPIDKNDLPEALKVLKEYQQTLRVSSTIKESDGKETLRVSPVDEKAASFAPEADTALLVPISKLAETGDYNLSADRYREVIRAGKQTYPMVALGDVCIEIKSGFAFGGSVRDENGIPHLRPMNITTNGALLLDDVKYLPASEKKNYLGFLLKKDDVLFNNTNSKELVGKTCLIDKDVDLFYSNHMTRIRTKPELNSAFLAHVLRSLWQRGHFLELCNKWVGQAAVNAGMLATLQIPLPPLETQRQIVGEIAAHQRIIDGARQVVEGWKPNLELDDDLETMKLGDVCDVRTGKLNSNAAKDDGEYPFFTCSKEVFKIDTYAFDCEAILLSGNNASGDFDVKRYKGKFNAYQRTYVISIKNEYANRLDYQILQTTLENNLASLKYQSIGGLTKYLTLGMITSIEIPLLPLDVQREIVARIETERAVVEGNRELIKLYEAKVKKVIERVWDA